MVLVLFFSTSPSRTVNKNEANFGVQNADSQGLAVCIFLKFCSRRVHENLLGVFVKEMQKHIIGKNVFE